MNGTEITLLFALVGGAILGAFFSSYFTAICYARKFNKWKKEELEKLIKELKEK